MKTPKYSEPQILAILSQAESGVPVSELCREHGMLVMPPRREPRLGQVSCDLADPEERGVREYPVNLMH